MYKHILLPTDGSELGNKALGDGLQLAKLVGAKVTALTVQPPLRDYIVEGVAITLSEEDRAAYDRQMMHNLDQAKAKATEMGVEVETVKVENDQPWEAIVEAAKGQGCDLIVMASHGRRGLSALLLGSETQKVLTHSKVPVLVVR